MSISPNLDRSSQLLARLSSILFVPALADFENRRSIMLVAQNSEITPHADGGCLGNPDSVRSPSARIKLRAVNAQHLAFVWGESHWESPVIGRMYGSKGEAVKEE